MPGTFVVALLAFVLALLPAAALGDQDQVGPSLTPVVWELVGIQHVDFVIVPVDPTRYTVQFRPDGRAAIRLDCNIGSASYLTDGDRLSVGPLTATDVACVNEGRAAEVRIADAFGAALSEAQWWTYETSDPQRTRLDQLRITTTDGPSLLFRMSLHGVIWQWHGAQTQKPSTIVSDDPSRYTLQFLPDDSWLVQADCYRGTLRWPTDGGSSDPLYDPPVGDDPVCGPGSQADSYLTMLRFGSSIVVAQGTFDLYVIADGPILGFVPVVADGISATPQP